MRAPAFWWQRPDGAAAAWLRPAAALYGAVAGWRLRRRGVRIGVPVVCVGNLTLGGAGKTPAALALARLLAAAGERPVLLTRGYGGRLKGPLRVNARRHSAAEVGDEPLLLARAFPTIVAHDRVAGGRIAVADGASVVVMDDGFQNPSLVKDCAVLVVDTARGIGNGLVFPAGPLRAPRARQLACAHAVLMVGTDAAADAVADAARRRGTAIFKGRIEPDIDALVTLRRRPVLAFAGIGDPEKFFRTLAEAGIEVRERRMFPDHHPYSEHDAEGLLTAAKAHKLALVTTEKDHVRLTGGIVRDRLRQQTTALPVTLAFDAADAVRVFVLAQIRT
jgi:tetraacyldisaccharide 4'-kinase